MELAMHSSDSGSSVKIHALYGSEWTVCPCLLIRTVAFPSSVCQQLLELSDKPRKEVASFGWCYSLWYANLDSTEESWYMLFSAGLSLPSLFSTMMDCTQCA